MISTLTGNSAGPIAGYIATGKSSSRRLNVSSTHKNALAASALGTQPTDTFTEVFGVAFSADYLAAAHGSAASGGAFVFYSRSGSVFSSVSVPGNINCNRGDCAISADGLYASAASSVSGGRIWHNGSGTLTQLSSVGTIDSNSRATAVSSDGKYVAFLSSTAASRLRIKERSGSGSTATYADMTLASQPASGAAGAVGLGGLAFSPNDVYLAVAPSDAADMTVYKLNSGTGIYEKLASPWSGTTPTDNLTGCAFDPSGDILAISTSGAETFIYSRSSDTFTYEATLASGKRGGFHASGNYYISGSGIIYRKNSASSWTQLTIVTAGNCAAFSPAI